MAAGTASEVALAIKANKRIILLNQDEITIRFFKNMGTYRVVVAENVEDTIRMAKEFVTLPVNRMVQE
jgi:hypothetical protein